MNSTEQMLSAAAVAVEGQDALLAMLLCILSPMERVRLVGTVCRRWDRILLQEISFVGTPHCRCVLPSALAFLIRRAGKGACGNPHGHPHCGQKNCPTFLLKTTNTKRAAERLKK